MKNVLFLLVILGLFSCGSKMANVAKTPEGKQLMEEKNSYEKIPWIDISEAEALVKAKPRKLVVDVYTDWCGPCKMMDRKTFVDKQIIDHLSKDFYPVKFNAEGPQTLSFMGKDYGNPNHVPNKRGRNSKHELSGFFSVRGYPTLVVMDEKMNIIDKIVGYKTPDALLLELKKHINTKALKG